MYAILVDEISQSRKAENPLLQNHLYPGPLKTSMTSRGESEWLIKIGFGIAAQVIGNTAEHFSEIVLNVGTKWEPARSPEEQCRTWGASGERVSPREYPKIMEVRERVWNFLEATTGVSVQHTT